MALRINTNVASVFSQKHLSRSQERLAANFRKLSSGLRITRAADDAAGLAVSEKMRAHIKSTQVAMRNTQDGVSMVQTAEGSLSEIGSILSRMRELAVEASSGVLQTTERAYLSTEFVALQSEIGRIAGAADFNGLALADGSVSSVLVQVGINNVSAQDRLSVSLQTATVTAFAVSSAQTALLSAGSAQSAIAALDTAINSANTKRAALGSSQNRLSSAARNLEVSYENLVASESAVRDVDFASETADMTRNNIFQQAGVAVLAQANVSPQIALQLLQ